jgi:hypothetical protein
VYVTGKFAIQNTNLAIAQNHARRGQWSADAVSSFALSAIPEAVDDQLML